MFLLDTNVVSELRRRDKVDANVLRWAVDIPDVHLYLSSVTILEIELGVLLRERKDARQGAIFRSWLQNQILPDFDGRILPVDVFVAQRCAHLHVPNPRSVHDAMIAATALVHGMTVVTRNVADFESTGVQVFDPWNT